MGRPLGSRNRKGSVRQRALAMVLRADGEIRALDIVDQLGRHHQDAVHRALCDFAGAGTIHRVRPGYYEVA